MTFNPHTDDDRAALLAAAGVSNLEEFFVPVPKYIRFPNFDFRHD